MSNSDALRQIIILAANALAEEGGEEVEMEGDGEESEDGMQAEDETGEAETEEVNPAAVRATALRIKAMRDAE
jgi:hypothetical protein